MKKHKQWEIWKDFFDPKNGIWKLQLPKGVLTFKRKKDAIYYRDESVKLFQKNV